MRSVVFGIMGAIATYLLIRWAGRRFPVKPKSHSLLWYRRRYGWIEWLGLVMILVGMGSGMWLHRKMGLADNDPRGAAVGFVLGCLLPLTTLIGICIVSPCHRFREYWDFQELKYGAKNSVALCLILPVFCVAAIGVVHLLAYH